MVAYLGYDPQSAGDSTFSAVPSLANPLFPVSSRDWFTVIH